VAQPVRPPVRPGVDVAPGYEYVNGQLVGPGGSRQTMSGPQAYQTGVGQYALTTPDGLALQAMQYAATLPYYQANDMLNYDRQYAGVANQYDERDLRLNYDADRSRLGNSRYRDVDLANVGNDNNLESARRKFNLTTEMSGRGLGLSRADLTRQLALAGSQHGLALNRADLAGSQARFAASNDAASRGAAGSTGYETTRNDIASQLGFDKRAANLAYEGANDQYRSGWDGAQLNYDNTMGQANNAWADAQADNGRQKQYIDSIAKDYGVTAGQMDQAFRNGLQRLGLDYATTMRKLSQQGQNNTAQAQAASAALAQQILMAAQGA
jgi:hypothetical protein